MKVVNECSLNEPEFRQLPAFRELSRLAAALLLSFTAVSFFASVSLAESERTEKCGSILTGVMSDDELYALFEKYERGNKKSQ